MKSLTPHLTSVPKRTVLAVTTIGSPKTMAKQAFSVLYGTAFATKLKVYKPKKKIMTMSPPSAIWPDAHLKPKTKWTAIWSVEVPAFVKYRDLLQKDPKRTVKVVTRPATTVAQILHVGPYSNEGATVKKLLAFVRGKKMKLAGPHEEVYLSRPGPKAKTLIRYAVKKVARR